MIELYTWKTANGRKVPIALEELGLPYRLHPVDLGADEQHRPAYLKLNRHAKIPTLVDPEGPDGAPVTLCESGAILIYLADKTGRLLAKAGAPRFKAVQWLMFEMSGVQPTFAQHNHYSRRAPERLPYAIDRLAGEIRRLCVVLDARLAEATYLAGDDYSIADIANFAQLMRHNEQGIDLAAFPHIQRWYEGILSRPAVARGCAVLR